MDTLSGILQFKTTVEEPFISRFKSSNDWIPEHFQVCLEKYFLAVQASNSRPEETTEDFNIVCIGDIRLDNYNYLIGKFHLTPGISNASVIKQLYKSIGVKLLQELIGAFSFILYDKEKDILFGAVDHIGFRSLHYAINKDHFVFGTLKKNLLCLPLIDKAPNWNFIVRKIQGLVNPASETEYASILRVPPAHYFTINKQRELSVNRYWELDDNKETIYKNPKDYKEHFIELMKQSVDARMKHINNPGVHLSGGLDSCAIAGVAAHLLEQKNKVLSNFSYVVPENLLHLKANLENENHLIADQIKFSKISNNYHIDTPAQNSYKDYILLEADRLDGFAQTNNLYTEYEIQLKAKEQHHPVILSGFGGDEMASSFTRPYYLEYLSKGDLIKYFRSKHRGKYEFKKLALPFLINSLDKLGINSIRDKAAFRYEKYLNRNRLLRDKEILKSHFNKDYKDFNPLILNALDAKLISRYPFGFPTSLKAYQKNHVQRDHTSRRIASENLSGLYFNVEYRYPLLDIRILQYVLSIPMEQKFSLEKNRLLFRESMKDFVPSSILDRDNKRGSIKPMSYYYTNKSLPSLIQLFKEFQDQNVMPFVKKDYLRTHLQAHSKLPKFIRELLILGQLSATNKLQF